MNMLPNSFLGWHGLGYCGQLNWILLKKCLVIVGNTHFMIRELLSALCKFTMVKHRAQKTSMERSINIRHAGEDLNMPERMNFNGRLPKSGFDGTLPRTYWSFLIQRDRSNNFFLKNLNIKLLNKSRGFHCWLSSKLQFKWVLMQMWM